MKQIQSTTSEPPVAAVPTSAEPQPEVVDESYSMFAGFMARLDQAGMSVLFTSYQSGVLYLVGRNDQGGVNVHRTAIRKPMGLTVSKKGGFVLMSATEVQSFVSGISQGQRVNTLFDACYVPRVIYYTGALDAHDVGILADGQG